MPARCPARPAEAHGAAPFEPSAALAYLDALAERDAAAASAWDAAWIACLTGSQRWAEAARAELSRLAALAPRPARLNSRSRSSA